MEFVTRRPWRLSNDCVGSLSSCFSPFFDLIFDLKFLNRFGGKRSGAGFESFVRHFVHRDSFVIYELIGNKLILSLHNLQEKNKKKISF